MDPRFVLFIIFFGTINCHEMQNNFPSDRMSRQISFWPVGSYSLSRQIYDMLDIVTDVAMLTILGIPILGLVALGATVLGPAIGTTAAAGRKKRSEDNVIERTKRALTYARNLFDVLANLEDAFRKYDITESECQLKAVCQVHKNEFSSSPFKEFADNIKNLLRLEHDLEEYEIIPMAKIIFGQYSDAATYGLENNDCGMIYSRCTHDLNYFLGPKKNPNEQEVNEFH